MQVYIELALLENFCVDFTLLYCAKLVCKNPVKIWRIAFSSVLGACFAVVFPLFGLNGIAAFAVKIISGVAICLLCGKFKRFKAYFKMTAVFFGFTALLGGALIAVFTLAGWDYKPGEGYLLSSVPIGVPMFCALILIIIARKIALKLKKTDKTEVNCKIYLGEKAVAISGFYDSGNRVYHQGQPVSVIPLIDAMKIIDESGIKDTVKIHTVAGSKKLKVFTADRIEIYKGDTANVVKDVKIGISPHASGKAVLHPDLIEE